MKKCFGFALAEGASHGAIFANGRKSAFTLAEVLITLGIIGVVAAMTMPTLMNSTNGAQYRTAYKKALSVLSQAVVLNVALDDYDLSQTVSGVTANSANIYNLFKNRMNVVKEVNGGTEGAEGWTASNASDVIKFGGDAAAGSYTLFFNDGITFVFDTAQFGCTEGNKTTAGKMCYGFIDVNGAKNPNKAVVCDGASKWDEGYISTTTTTEEGKETSTTSTSTGNNTCTVSNPTDIYPVVMYDQSILPNSDAARAVLYGGK